MTHTSGLPPIILPIPQLIQLGKKHLNKNDILQKIEQLHLNKQPGTHFEYSDINFMILGYLVERITGETLDRYTQKHLFQPLLGMHHTFFLPHSKQQDNIAPTEIIDGQLRWGIVHDPAAYVMGGVSGHASLFSNADDLRIYIQCLLNAGAIFGKKTTYLFGPLTVLKMITPQTRKGAPNARGLGWDIDSSFTNRGVLFPTQSFGHTGWTGTSIWIDPVTQTFLIILTSRVHPYPAKNNLLIQDRKAIATIVAASITDINIKNNAANNTSAEEISRAYHGT